MNIMDRILGKFGYSKKGIGPLYDDSRIYRSLRSLLASSDSLEVEEPYQKSVWVFASINAIAQNISRVPFYVYTEKTRDTKKVVQSGALYDLFTNPNPFMISSTLFFSTIVFMELYGECFWLLGDRANVTEIPSEIWCVTPTRFEPMLDKDKMFRGYWKYELGDYKKVFAPHQILHFSYFNPYDELRGLSPIEASKTGVEQDFYANKYNKQFFKNGAALSGIIKAPDFLTDDQFNRLRNQFEERHAGYDNAHKIGIIEGGADFVETRAMSQKDMEFNILKNVIRGEILAAFKTNEVVLGNYSEIQCFHPDTEVLTDKGFVNVADIKLGDNLASLSPDGDVEYKETTNIYSYDYDGVMYVQNTEENDVIDFCVTPEHKMYGVDRIEKFNRDFGFKKISDIENQEGLFWSLVEDSGGDNYECFPIIPEKINYKGKVHCFEVPPYHTVFMRYNGKSMWCGNSYEGISQAHASFWKETLLPKMIYLEDYLWSKFFSKIEGGKYWGGFDTSVIEALRDDFGAKVEMAKTLAEIGYPINAINKRLDLGFEDFEWGNTWWVKVGVVPVDSILNGELPPPSSPTSPTEEPNDEPDEEEPEEDPDDTISEDEPTEPDEGKTMVDISKRDDSLWSAFIARQIPIEDMFKNKIKRFLFEQRKRVLNGIYQDNYSFDFATEVKLFSNILTPIYDLAKDVGVELLQEEVTLDLNINTDSFVADRIKFSSNTILNTILKQVTSALEEENLEVKAEKIKKIYNKANNRIETIARTESCSIINGIRYLLMKDSGIMYHKWICKSEKGRHDKLNGKIVRIGESFEDNFTLRYPNDSLAPVSSVINCRCLTVPVIKAK